MSRRTNNNNNNVVPMNINSNNASKGIKRKSINILNNNLPRKQINSTRSTPEKETILRIDVRLPNKTVQELRRIMLLTNKENAEYMGTIDMRRAINKDVIFDPPSRETSGNRMTIRGNYTKIDDSFLSYHSHPGYNGYFTLPSNMDMIKYTELYPRMQINIILDHHGYYVIDFIETRRNDRPIQKLILDEYEKTLNKRIFKNLEYLTDGTVYYKSNIGSWKRIIEKEFRNTKGISIKFYGYNENALITLLNKELFPIYDITNRK